MAGFCETYFQREGVLYGKVNSHSSRILWGLGLAPVRFSPTKNNYSSMVNIDLGNKSFETALLGGGKVRGVGVSVYIQYCVSVVNEEPRTVLWVPK